MTLYVLKIGDKVRLKNGIVATITRVYLDDDFKYCIEGEAHFDVPYNVDGATRRYYAWTRTGKYYDDNLSDDRDIDEVIERETGKES